MIGKKINQLATELAPVSTDLTIIGDPDSGVSKKITLAQLGAIFSGAVSFYTNLAAFPAIGSTDVIYCAKDTQKLYLWSGSAYTEVFPSQALLNTYQLRSEKGVSNGYASLDSGGKVPISQLPSSIMEYKGTWNAATNTPTLANGTGDTGDVYICNVAGTVNFGAGPLTFAVGDYVIYSGSIWQRSSGAVGTVTSVAATITGNAIGITGSPVTTSGTLALAFAGNSTQYINGAGNLVTFPGVINEAQNLITEVYNKTGATLTKGTVVYINGGQGNLPSVTKALATGDSTSAQTYGIVRNDITNNNNGYVVVAGRISDLDTQAYTEGTQLYLSPTTAGTYTSTKPYAPNHLVYVGIVVRAHPTQGVVEVKIQNGYEMDELHNVAAQNPDNNDILQYKTATSLWTKVAGTTSNIAEGSNLYYTDARSRAALSFTAGSGAYNSTTGVITIPTNTNQLTNGAAFITLASLSAGAGISYNNTTGVISSTITQYTDAMARASISETVTGLDYNSTTGVLSLTSGYVIPTTTNETNWNAAYNDKINSAAVTGTTTKTLTLTQQDGGTITASWTDDNTDAVTSVFGRTGAVVATSGDYNTSQVTENTNLYFTNARAIASTLTGYTSGAGTISATDTILSAIQKLNGNIGALTTGVSSVNGLTGAVTLTTSNIAEGTNLYYTEARVNANTNVAANTAARHNAVTLGTANGLSLSTQVLSLALASGSTTGALSSSDWTTFNNKQNALTNPVTGTGTTNYLPKFTGTSTIGDSAVYESGTNVGINTASPSSYTNLTTLTINGTNGSVIDLKTGNTLYGEIYSLTNELRIDAVGASSVLKFLTNSATRMTLDASGNLGLGVTPSAWWASMNAIEVGAGTSLFSFTNNVGLSSNSYFSASGWLYKNSSVPATKYETNAGQLGNHAWYNAPSGTAGNAISFTQAMTLNASGNLSIGNTNDTYKLDVSGTVRVNGSNPAYRTDNTTSYTSLVSYLSGTRSWQLDNVSNDFWLYMAGSLNTYVLKIAASTGAATFSSSVTAGSFLLTKGSITNDTGYGTGFNVIGSATTYIGSSTGIVGFVASGGEQMRLTTTGLGIGTTSPTRLFDVSATNPQMTLKSTTTTGFSEYYFSDSAGDPGYLSYAHNGDYLLFGVNSAERMRITSGGNVGIGTTSPAVKLDIQSSSSGTGLGDGMLLKLKNTSTTTDTRSGITFGNIDGIGGSLAMQSAILKSAATGEYDMTFDLYGGSAGWQEGLLYLDSNPGTVAIGTGGSLMTSTYTGRLSVNKTGSGANIVLGTGSNTNNAVMSRFVTYNSNNGNSGNEGATQFYGITSIESALTTSNSNASGNSGGYIMFKTKGDAGTLDERMRITSGGNVEINTGSIKTGEPDTGWGRAAIKIGAKVSGEAFNVDYYLPISVDGTVYYINLNSSTP